MRIVDLVMWIAELAGMVADHRENLHKKKKKKKKKRYPSYLNKIDSI